MTSAVPRYLMYCDRAGGWRWSLLAANNRIIADSGEAYVRKRECRRAIARVIVAAQTPLVKEMPP